MKFARWIYSVYYQCRRIMPKYSTQRGPREFMKAHDKQEDKTILKDSLILLAGLVLKNHFFKYIMRYFNSNLGGIFKGLS